MKMIKPLTLCLLLLLFCKICYATFDTGNTIYAGLEDYKRDNSTNLVSASISFGYVIGVHDALDGVVVCTPENTTKRQVIDIVFNYLRDNPQLRHKAADGLISQALVKFYPCKRK